MEPVTFEEALEWVGEYSKPERFADIRRHLDPAWLEDALNATGTATLRKGRLPAEQVLWLVVGMALSRDRPIYELGARWLILVDRSRCCRARTGGEGIRLKFCQRGTSIIKRDDRHLTVTGRSASRVHQG